MTRDEAIRTLTFSIQRALIGETDRMHSVTCGLEGRVITIKAHVRGAVTPEDVERVQMIGAEVIADFPEGYLIDEACVSLSEQREEMLDFWAFKRG